MRAVVFALVLCACGGSVAAVDAGELVDASDAGDVVDAYSPRVCYEPSQPLRAFSCDGEADCGACPASCSVDGVDAGQGVCE